MTTLQHPGSPGAQPFLVSIVTPCFNMARFLPEALESVLAQDYPRIEHIVVDGGSTDGTLEILERYRDRVSFTSTPDDGPADAIATGLRRAQGEILGWLNADDTLLPGAVRRVVEQFTREPRADIVYGEGWWVDENGSKIGRYPTAAFDEKILARECFICQPAAFFRASAYRGCEIDPTVACAFDYDLWIRMALEGRKFSAIPEYLATSRMHRGGLTLGQRGRVFQSSIDVLTRHYGYVPLSWVFGYTCFRWDGRDQFFNPLQPSALKYLAALLAGLRINRSARLRFLAEWTAKLFQTGARRIASPGDR